MDGTRFDLLLKSLTTVPSRRRVLQAMAGGSLAAAFGRIAGEDAAARKRNRCRGKPDFCKSDHDPAAFCGGGGLCACVTTVDGKKVCAEFVNQVCPTTDLCDSNEDCPGKNNLCFVIADCCPESPRNRNVCARRCGSGGSPRPRRT